MVPQEYLWREVEGRRVDYTWTVRGTLDTEIEALLGRLTDEIRRNTNDTLVGLYVYGSLVTGDFDKDRSDIDLLAVVDSDVEGDTFGRLDRMHARFVQDYPAWEDRIEVAYVPDSALLNFRTQTDQIAVDQPRRTVQPQGGRKRLAHELVHGPRSRRHPLRSAAPGPDP